MSGLDPSDKELKFLTLVEQALWASEEHIIIPEGLWNPMKGSLLWQMSL